MDTYLYQKQKMCTSIERKVCNSVKSERYIPLYKIKGINLYQKQKICTYWKSSPFKYSMV